MSGLAKFFNRARESEEVNLNFAIYNLGSVLGTIGSVIVAVLILLFMVTVHEAGHYFAGKIFGFKINEFAIGMGPAIFKKKMKNGEFFSIRIFPLGGFCAFEGEDEETDGKESDPGAFNNKKPWQRIIVLLAGATMNFVSAILILILATGIYGQSSFRAFEVMPATAESAYSLQTNDIIVKVNNKNIYIVTDLSDALKGKKKGDLVDVEVLRNSGSAEHVNAGDCVRETVKVRLLCDPISENLQDTSAVMKSLGIATIFGVNESNNTDFTKLIAGDYFLRITAEKPELFDAVKATESGYTDLTVFDEYKVKKAYAVNEEKYMAEKRMFTIEDLRNELRSYGDGETVYFYISRATETSSERILLEYKLDGFTDEVKSTDAGIDNYLGITSVGESYRVSSVGVRYGFFSTIWRGTVNAFNSAGVTFKALGQLLTGKLGIDAIGGPITTISVTSTYVSYGFEYLLQMAGLIGVSLAAFNILPIPALDGARAVFVLIEWIRGKPVNRKVEGMIHAIGLIALLVFAVVVDLVKFI